MKLFQNILNSFRDSPDTRVRSVYTQARSVYHSLVYLLVSPFTNSIQLVSSLWACRVILFKDWTKYSGLTELAAGTWPFYYRFSLELSRFGRKGISQNIGNGNFPLNKFFQHTESLSLFRKANIHLVLFSLLGWWLSHLVWLSNINMIWVAVIMGMILISSSFLGVLSCMNYNALGWLFFPLAVYGLQTGQWWLAGLAWLGAGFGSFTVVFIGGVFTLLSVILSQSLYPVLAFLPACIKLIPNFLPLLANQKITEIFMNTAKVIGLVQGKEIRYKRPSIKESLFVFKKMYLLLAFVQFIIVLYIVTGNVDPYLITGLLLFLINASVARFSDDQNILVLLLSLSSAAMIRSYNEHHYILQLISFWILISPFPTVAGLSVRSLLNYFFISESLAPVNIRGIMEKFQKFFTNVKPGEKVMMAFEDPCSEYIRVFDGLRFHIEFPLYVATQNNFLLFPDWVAVTDSTTEDAPNLWGREPSKVLTNMQLWHANYAMIYQFGSEALDNKWSESGFSIVNQCTWKLNELTDRDHLWYFNREVNWWLIRKT